MAKNKHLFVSNGREESFDCRYTDNSTVRTTCFVDFYMCKCNLVLWHLRKTRNLKIEFDPFEYNRVKIVQCNQIFSN